jgi:ankyrin repeat protein
MRQAITGCCAALLLAGAAFAAGSDVADAVMNKDKAAVRALLQKKADVNAAQADGTTALEWAVRQDDMDTVDALIRAGANVNAANHDGATAMYLACVNGSAWSRCY